MKMNDSSMRRGVFLGAVALAAVVTLTFGVDAFRKEMITLGIFDLAVSVISLGILWGAYRKPYSMVPNWVFVGVMASFFVYLFASGGHGGTGLLFLLLLPMATPLFLGWKHGVAISLICLLVCAVLAIVGNVSSPFPGIPEDTLLARLGAIYVVSLVLSSLYDSGMQKAYGDERWAKEALRDSEEKLRRMFESVSDGISVVDVEGIITDVNQRTVEMHGFDSKSELRGRSAFELLAPRDHQRIATDMKKAMKQEAMRGVEYTLRRADGSEFPGELSTSVLKDASGNPIGHITIARDISERKKMQEQLILADRLASIGQLVSGIAHELNNPLTGVIGFSDLLLRRDLPADVKNDLETVNREARRTSNIVRGLLAFARQQETEKALVDVNGIVQEVLWLRSYDQRVNSVEVDARFATGLPQVLGSRNQLQQVFINIIINAEQAMLGARGKGRLTVATERVGDAVRASVIDDGPGISPENMKRLFTPFFTTKEVGKGTGLGLSICHGIVTEHGGRIYAESEPGEGATFVVELPVGKRSE